MRRKSLKVRMEVSRDEKKYKGYGLGYVYFIKDRKDRQCICLDTVKGLLGREGKDGEVWEFEVGTPRRVK